MTTLNWTSDVTRIPESSLLGLMKEAVQGDESGWNFTQRNAGHVEAMFGPGMTGFFAMSGGDVVGMARVLSDDFLCSWLAEICVHRDWRGRGIGRQLVEKVRHRFGHTATYVHTPISQLDFFLKCGLLRKKKLIATYDYHPEQEIQEAAHEGVRITHDVDEVTSAAFTDVYNSVGFGIRNANPQESLEKCFGPTCHGCFAFAGERLVGAARVISDNVATTWMAELCVHPDWQNKGVGGALLASVRRRFSHTGLYSDVFSNQIDFFSYRNHPPREKWLALSISRVRDEAVPILETANAVRQAPARTCTN